MNFLRNLFKRNDKEDNNRDFLICFEIDIEDITIKGEGHETISDGKFFNRIEFADDVISRLKLKLNRENFTITKIIELTKQEMED